MLQQNPLYLRVWGRTGVSLAISTKDPLPATWADNPGVLPRSIDDHLVHELDHDANDEPLPEDNSDNVCQVTVMEESTAHNEFHFMMSSTKSLFLTLKSLPLFFLTMNPRIHYVTFFLRKAKIPRPRPRCDASFFCICLSLSESGITGLCAYSSWLSAILFQWFPLVSLFPFFGPYC